MNTTMISEHNPTHWEVANAETSAAAAGGSPPTIAQSPQRRRSPFPSGRPPRILLVDDEPINIKVVQKYLSSAGYADCHSTNSAAVALELAMRVEPDAVLLDVLMPDGNGLDVLADIRAEPRLTQVPVVMLTAAGDRTTKCRALELGATDFLAKPVDPSELVLRIGNVLAVKAHLDHLRVQAEELERLVHERTLQLQASHRSVIHCLARAAECRDDDTGQHVLRVGRFAAIIARQLGWDGPAAEMLGQAAQLHDVGKLGIPDAILLKPGKLTAQEYKLMQKHCDFGKQVFDSLTDVESATVRRHAELGDRMLSGCGSAVLDMAAQIALTHHEWWDGSGCPRGLAGEDIPLVGRITAVADVFDALSSSRHFKPAFPLDKCFAILLEGEGSQFDPRVLAAFLAAQDEIVGAYVRFAGRD